MEIKKVLIMPLLEELEKISGSNSRFQHVSLKIGQTDVDRAFRFLMLFIHPDKISTHVTDPDKLAGCCFASGLFCGIRDL